MIPALEVEIYYIVVEALNNVVKHAAARSVCVRLATDAAAVRILIADDGAGYDEQRAGRGLGLRSMRERVAKLNGRLTITGGPGVGTVVEAEIPIRTEANE
jgi:signal transduction histidine kinase